MRLTIVAVTVVATGFWLATALTAPQPVTPMPEVVENPLTITNGPRTLRVGNTPLTVALPSGIPNSPAPTPRAVASAAPRPDGPMPQRHNRVGTPPSAADGADPRSDSEWATHRIAPGDTLGKIFARYGLDSTTAVALAKLADNTLHQLRPDRVLRLEISPDATLRTLEYSLSPLNYLFVRSGDGPGAENADFIAEIRERDHETERRFASGAIETSLYQAGSDAGIDDNLLAKFASIYQWTVDFSTDLHPGDRFAFVYDVKTIDGRRVGSGSIAAAMLVTAGRTHWALGHTDSSGRSGYYTPEGESLQGTFLRTPVAYTRISSSFNKRRFHPILKTWRSHQGVDYAAATGTPVVATADGTVVATGRHGGYGKTVIVQHRGSYTTLYAHLSGFAKGVRKGTRVQQGQTIGYVGKTGLATGPHLHYELRINGVHHNPLTVELPRANPVAITEREAFLESAAAWMAMLEQPETTLLAHNSGSGADEDHGDAPQAVRRL